MYLMIQNKGVAPETAYTLLGASNTRTSSVEGTIGQFGTGSKHAISTLLRAGLKVRIYCGKTRMDFQTRSQDVNDGLTVEKHERVVAKFRGTSTRTDDLGWVLAFGAIDWTDVGMSLREFISNALDRTMRENDGEFAASIKSGDLVIAPVHDDKGVRAKDGYTRVFVEMDDDGAILRYLSELPKRFLHFSRNPEQVKCGLLPKNGRNLSGDTPMIYRCGVFVKELKETKKPSLYDYNFIGKQLSIDDCRNSNEYSIRAACAKRLRKADARDLAPVLRALASGVDCFESDLDSYYLRSTVALDSIKEDTDKEWKEAWKIAHGDKVVASDTNNYAMAYAARKGYEIAEMPSNWAIALAENGITTTNAVLNDNEKKGREIIEPTEAAVSALDEVWDWIDVAGKTSGKSKPGIACYRENTDAESDIVGFYKLGDEKIHTREDISDGRNKFLLKTVLEELTHYVTGSRDNTRDFQNFVMDMLVDFLS